MKRNKFFNPDRSYEFPVVETSRRSGEQRQSGSITVNPYPTGALEIVVYVTLSGSESRSRILVPEEQVKDFVDFFVDQIENWRAY